MKYILGIDTIHNQQIVFYCCFICKRFVYLYCVDGVVVGTGTFNRTFAFRFSATMHTAHDASAPSGDRTVAACSWRIQSSHPDHRSSYQSRFVLRSESYEICWCSSAAQGVLVGPRTRETDTAESGRTLAVIVKMFLIT